MSYLDSINSPSIRGDGAAALVTEEESETTVALVTEEESETTEAGEELETSPYFCNCFSSMEAMDLFDLSLTPTPVPNGIFDMSDCCLPEVTVRCDHHTSFDVVPSSVQAYDPSPKGLIGASMGTVDLLYKCDNTSFPVVFDSGASLAISMYASDFVGPIRPLNRTLGGLANGLDIKGIGTVHWKFRCKDSIMTVVSSAYYVPSAKARLLSPQRLFCANKGVTGKFVVNEHNNTLSFDGVGELSIDYDSGNHLPTSLAKNYTPGQTEIVPKVHLAGVLSEENTNLSPAGKLLLH